MAGDSDPPGGPTTRKPAFWCLSPTAFEPAKLEEGEESLVLRLHPQAHGGPCGPPTSPCVARHCFGRGLSIHNGQQKARRALAPCHSQRIAHWGPCGKARVVVQNLRPRPEPVEIRDSRSTCAFFDGAEVRVVRAAGLRGAAGRNATLSNGGSS